MKTPSSYPVLDNRPIDQWKVTELKEELKRRKLTTKGLKDDLVRRLDEALQDEILDPVVHTADVSALNDYRQPAAHTDDMGVLAGTLQRIVQTEDVGVLDCTLQPIVQTEDVGVLDGTLQPIVQTQDVGVLDGTLQPVDNVDVEGEGETVIYEKTENTTDYVNGTDNSGVNMESVVHVTSVETSTVVNEVLPGEGFVQDGEGTGAVGTAEEEDTLVHITSVETTITVSEAVTDGVGMDVQESPKNDIQSVGDDLRIPLENQESGPPQDVELNSSDPSNQVSEVSTDVPFQVFQLEAEVAKPLHDDVKLNSSDPSNQVSEVSTVLGFQVKSDSISSDCVSINQKNELKDNIISDNINLELDVKSEMVNPSSSNVVSDRSEPHPMDVEDMCVMKEHVKEGDVKADLEMSKKNDSLDVGSSEKLNLDRSSGDDSMDDDTMENKPIDSKHNSEGVGDQGKKIEGYVMDEAPVVMSDDIPAEMTDADGTKEVPAAPLVKRKLNDQKVVGNNEISKRQRRWNTDNLKVPEPQSNLGSSTTPKNMLPVTTLKRNFSRLDSTASEGIPKERVVPPSPKPPTTSLRIDQFVRPFTLKAVQELLGKTGSVISFWMDHIKTHCYVSYSSVEEATATRNAVYNLQWPPNGGRLLLAEFVDPQEVKTRAEAPPPSPATPVRPGPTVPSRPPSTTQPPRQPVQRQQPLPPPPSIPLPPPPPLSNPPQTRERLPPPPPMEELEKMDTPIVTLDDLFRKTKTTPRIYYLPLTDGQVAAKRRNIRN